MYGHFLCTMHYSRIFLSKILTATATARAAAAQTKAISNSGKLSLLNPSMAWVRGIASISILAG